MESEVLVSVVIPTYNAEKFIRESLEAAIRQSYRNIEIIVVDDGSGDSTIQICQSYADKDSRIRLFTHENSGVSATRNRGIRHAKGEYIVFVDADDYPEDDMIECYLSALEQWKDKELAFVVCGMYTDNLYNKHVENTESILEDAHGYVRGENYLLTRSSAATLSWLKLFNFVTNKLYDLRKIKENGIWFDNDIKIGEDLKFNLDYLEQIDGYIGMINKPLYHYVKRSDSSLSISYHDGDVEDTKDIYRRLIKWESNQPGVTEDNVLLIKGIYITDWVSRLTSLYEKHHKGEYRNLVNKKLREELQSREFKETLYEVYKSGKISTIRYYSLKIGSYEVFFFLRGIYQLLKG